MPGSFGKKLIQVNLRLIGLIKEKMKFISNFCLYLIVIVTIWVASALFVSCASIVSWGLAIALAAVCALTNKTNGGKHDE